MRSRQIALYELCYTPPREEPQAAHHLHLPRVKLNNNVTLLHEIGHARQWIEHPGWFDNDYRTQTQQGDKRMKDISAKEVYLKARQMQQKTASGKGAQTDGASVPPGESLLPHGSRLCPA
jgi:hypothetical protein